jgi:hypothetical protein
MKARIYISLAALALFCGCRTPHPDAAESAVWVEIPGQSPETVRLATEAVFREQGFKLATSGLLGMTFEKLGGTWQDITYGGWQAGTWNRVKVTVTSTDNGGSVVGASAYAVRDKGDRVMEDEVKMWNQKPCRKLIDMVKERVAAGAPAP